jgi:DnaJ-domain-containing protein 1
MTFLAVCAIGLVVLVFAGRSPGLTRAWLRRWAGRKPAPDMNVAAARAILGVTAGASREEIEAAYRRLMLRAHPDQGGSAGLAAQLNLARDRLLRS